ncbi:hypothetical protein F4804DRAFT_306398 [Jackrogersella minutella]|nr:hypothetical protein F4804DRAFT_306398 [Jackrogersella minutella]
MYSKFAVAVLISALFSHQAASQVGLFSCYTRQNWGFTPKCCENIDGQVGINCVGAHQMGATDPIWECNLFVYNITGCCQSIGYKNPYNNYTIDLCATSVDS